MIPDSFIQELRYRCDIEQIISPYVNLKRRGRNLVGICPFHSEKTPSFTVYPESQSYFCFGCSAGGDAITFIRNIENLEYVEAVKFLAERVGMTVPDTTEDDTASKMKVRILEINRETARFYHSCLKAPMGQQALKYLTDRGLSIKTIVHFGLGYAPNDWRQTLNHLKSKGFTEKEILASGLVLQGRNGGLYDQFRDRVMFPIIDIRGNVIAFGARLLNGTGPKYINSSDTPVYKKSRNLFALNFAKNVKSDTMILAEGYMDVIALHQAGFENAVATLGTALTSEQSRMISNYAQKVVISYDSDEAGQKAAKRALQLFDQTGVSVRILNIKDAKDPDEFIKKFGAQRFKLLIEGASSAIDFEIAKVRQKYDMEQSEDKVSFLKEIVKVLADISNKLEREVYILKIVNEFGISKEALTSNIENELRHRYNQQKKREKTDLRTYNQVMSNEKGAFVKRDELKSEITEGRLLALLIKYPDLIDDASHKLKEDDFTTKSGKNIFNAMNSLLKDEITPDMMTLSSKLEPEDMAKLSRNLASINGMSFQKADVGVYIDTIKALGRKKTDEQIATMNDSELDGYIRSIASRKETVGGNF